ncbi:MAG: PEP-CTERM sorting domain-containing protein [Planctomycetia bacterium]
MSSTKLLRAVIGAVLFASALVSSHVAIAVPTSWNAFNDFYLSPTATGWTGATSPSSTGAAWGYYDGNVNGSSFPSQIGSYFTPSSSGAGSQSLYQFSNVSPLGSGYFFNNTGWAATGGAGFAYYADNQGWGTSLGSYPTPWFSGAPGYDYSLSNFIWMQPAWLNGPGVEGIAPVLSWTAPASGDYTFSGQWVTGNQPGNSASAAIVDSLGGSAIQSRTALANNSLNPFSFTKSYSAGDVVQFQVGSNFATGNAVGLQLNVVAVPEPSSIVLLATAAAGAAVCAYRRRK